MAPRRYGAASMPASAPATACVDAPIVNAIAMAFIPRSPTRTAQYMNTDWSFAQLRHSPAEQPADLARRIGEYQEWARCPLCCSDRRVARFSPKHVGDKAP